MTTWKEKVSILHLEYNPDDVELLKLVLSKFLLDFTIETAATKEEFEVLFGSKSFDLVITDYNLNGYNGYAAILQIRAQDPIIPIILFSGTVGEEMAANLLTVGANDFISKTNLKKVIIVIERVLSESRLKREKLRFQKELVEKNLILDTVFDSFENMVFLKDEEGKYLKVNKSFCNFFELREEEVIGKLENNFFPSSISELAEENDELVMFTGKKVSYDIDHIDSQGKRGIVEVIKTPLMDGNKVVGIVGECRNITKQRLLIESKEKAQFILMQAEKLTDSGSFEYDAEQDILNCSSNFKRMTNLKIEGNSISLRKFAHLIKEEDRAIFIKGLNEAIETRTEYYMQHRFEKGNGSGHFKVLFKPDYKDSKWNKFYGTIIDVTAEHENHIYTTQKQEEDRKEIARELHDNLGQKLNAVSMFVSKISDDFPDIIDLEKIKNIVHESIDDLDSLISNISVKQVEEHSLDYALSNLISYLPEFMEVNSSINLNEEDISPFVKSQLFRIIQEVFNNVCKYSDASSLKMDLNQEGSILNLLIEDDGKGFELEKGKKGNGLKNISHRVSKSNGLIDICSAIGKGTRVNIKMPTA